MPTYKEEAVKFDANNHNRGGRAAGREENVGPHGVLESWVYATEQGRPELRAMGHATPCLDVRVPAYLIEACARAAHAAWRAVCAVYGDHDYPVFDLCTEAEQTAVRETVRIVIKRQEGDNTSQLGVLRHREVYEPGFVGDMGTPEHPVNPYIFPGGRCKMERKIEHVSFIDVIRSVVERVGWPGVLVVTSVTGAPAFVHSAGSAHFLGIPGTEAGSTL